MDFKLGFIGAGSVGSVLSYYWYKQGLKISGFFNRTKRSAQICADRLEVNAFNQLKDLVIASDWICISVNDDQIEAVANEIFQLELDLKGKYFFHTSGVHCSEILNPIHQRGGKVFSLHPLQSFSKFEVAINQLPKTHFSLEGMIDDNIECWLKERGIQYFKITSEQKARYHLAAVVVSNYLVSTLSFGLDQMNQIGLSDAHALNAFWPLIEGTIENVKNVGVKNALTGPIVRGDSRTVEKHLKVLTDDFERLMYSALGLQALNIAKDRGVDADACERLTKMLMGGLKCQK